MVLQLLNISSVRQTSVEAQHKNCYKSLYTIFTSARKQQQLSQDNISKSRLYSLENRLEVECNKNMPEKLKKDDS